MNYYEIPFAVSTEIPVQGIESFRTRLLDTLEKHEGSIIGCEYWGVRSLAYKINKQSKGRYFVLKIQSNHSFPADIIKYFKINEIILRYAIYKQEGFNESPSPILANLLKTPEYCSTDEEKSFSNIFSKQSQ